MLIRFFRFPLLLVACLLLFTATFGQAQKGLLLCGKADMRDGGYTSPDGKFIVVSKTGDGEDVYVVVREKKNLNKILFQSSSVSGFSWLPNKGHQLVFAVSTDNNGETPGIFLWQSGKSLKKLKGVKGLQNVALYGMTTKGDKLVYQYWPDLMENNPSKFGPFIKSLKMP